MRRCLAAFLWIVLCAAFFFCVPALAENTLTISWPADVPQSDASNTRMQYALSKMQEKYPGMKVVNVTPPKSAAVLLAEKKGADIIALIDGAGVFLPELYENGSVKDLLAYGPIAQVVADWPDLSRLMGEEGKLFALPQKLLPRLMEVKRPELLAKLSAQTDFTGWTWDEFFDLGDALYDYNAKNGTSYLLACDDGFTPMWLSQYMENEHFARDAEAPDAKSLESLLTRWKKAADQQLIRWDPAGGAADASAVFTFGYERFPYLGSRRFVPIPVYRQGTCATEVSAEYLLVNAASPKAEMALDFLAFYNAAEAFGPLADSSQNDGVVRDGSTAGVQEHRMLWRDALENGYLRRVPKEHKDLLDALQAYVKGDLDLAACVKVITDIAAKR